MKTLIKKTCYFCVDFDTCCFPCIGKPVDEGSLKFKSCMRAFWDSFTPNEEWLEIERLKTIESVMSGMHSLEQMDIIRDLIDALNVTKYSINNLKKELKVNNVDDVRYCENECGHVIQGRPNKRYCSKEDNPQCYFDRKAKEKRENRSKKKYIDLKSKLKKETK